MTNKIIFKKGQRWILPKYDNLEVEVTKTSMSDKVQVKFTSVFDTVVSTSLSRDGVYWETAKLVVDTNPVKEPLVPTETELVEGDYYALDKASGTLLFRLKQVEDSSKGGTSTGVRAYYATVLGNRKYNEFLAVGSIVSRSTLGIRTASKEEVSYLEDVTRTALHKVESDVTKDIISCLATPYQKDNYDLTKFTDSRELIEFIIAVKEPVDSSGVPLVDGKIYTLVTEIGEHWVFRYKKPSRTTKNPKDTSCYSCTTLEDEDFYYATSGFVTADKVPIREANAEEANALIWRDHVAGHLVFKDLD